MWIFKFLCLCSVFVLACGQRSCPLNATSPTKQTINFGLRACIANCLGLVRLNPEEPEKPCKFNPKSGNAVNETCEKKFLPARQDKKILCLTYLADLTPHLESPSINSCDFLAMTIVKYKGDGALEMLNKVNKKLIGPQLEEMRQLGVKIILTMGSWDSYTMAADNFSTVAASKTLTAQFAESLNQTLHTYKLSGVLVIWNWPGCPRSDCKRRSDKANVVNFSREVLGPLKNQGFKVFFCVQAADPDQMVFLGDYFSEIIPFVDYFPINSHEQSGRWADRSEYTNSLRKQKDLLTKLFNLVSDKTFPDKIMYGICASSPLSELFDPKVKQKYNALLNKKTKLPEFINFNEFCDYLQNGTNFTLVKNAEKQSYAYSDQMFFPYDDSTSLKAKANFLLERGAGFFIASMNADTFSGKCASTCGKMHFSRVAAEYLKGGDCILPPPCF